MREALSLSAVPGRKNAPESTGLTVPGHRGVAGPGKGALDLPIFLDPRASE
jgi:hypothetical protein